MPILGVIASAISGNLVTGSYESISTNTLSSNSNTVTISSIPSTYKHLQLRMFAKHSGGSGIADAIVTFNGDTGSNYTKSWTFTFDGGGPYTSRGTASSGFSMGYFANNGSTSLFGTFILDLVDYSNTNKYKTATYLNGVEKTSAGTTTVVHGTGSWLNTAAISSISINCGDAISAGSTFALYGIKG
jgi:hypothetical protein